MLPYASGEIGGETIAWTRVFPAQLLDALQSDRRRWSLEEMWLPHGFNRCLLRPQG